MYFYKYPTFIGQLMRELNESPQIDFEVNSNDFLKGFPSILDHIKNDKHKVIKSGIGYSQCYFVNPTNIDENCVLTFDHSLSKNFNDVKMENCFHFFIMKEFSFAGKNLSNVYQNVKCYQLCFSIGITKPVDKMASLAYILFLQYIKQHQTMLLCDSEQTDDGMYVWQEILTSPDVNRYFGISLLDTKEDVEKNISDFKDFDDIWNSYEEYQNVLVGIKNFRI